MVVRALDNHRSVYNVGSIMRVLYNEDTMQPDTTPPSVCVKIEHHNQYQTHDNYWREIIPEYDREFYSEIGRKGKAASPWKEEQ